jgi:hypothetical protein
MSFAQPIKRKRDGEIVTVSQGPSVSQLQSPVDLEDEKEKQRMLKLLEESSTEPAMDVKKVKHMVKSLQDKISANEKLRAKYADSPENFMESESALDEELIQFRILSESPEHYPTVVSTGAGSSLISLLRHENLDISLEALQVFMELTDTETILNEQKSMILIVTLVFDSYLFWSISPPVSLPLRISIDWRTFHRFPHRMFASSRRNST